MSFIAGPEHDIGYLDILILSYSAYTDVKVEGIGYEIGREVTENNSLPPRPVV